MKRLIKRIMMRILWVWFKLARGFHPDRAVSLKKVLVLNLTGIGDSVCLIPFLHRMQKGYPEMKLWGGFFSSQTSLMKNLFSFDGTISGNSLGNIIRDARKQDFSLVIIPGWALKHAFVGLRIGVPLLGFINDRSFKNQYLSQYTLEGVALKTSLEKQDMTTSHLIERPNLILKFLGLDAIQYSSYALPFTPENGCYVVIHATARFAGRRWSEKKFATLIDALSQQLSGLDAVYLTGSSEDIRANEAIISMCHSNVINKAGKIAMKDIPAFFKHAGLFIGNDSGPMHIAAFSGTPTIGLMGPNLPELSGPVGQYAHSVFHKQSCSPCEQKTCAHDFACMKSISVEEVVAVAKKMWRIS